MREAKANAPAAPAAAPQVDPVAELKQKVGEASSAYKAAVKAAKEAEANGDDNAAELRASADTLKAEADTLKAELREAKANAPAATPAPATPPPADPLVELKAKVGEASAAYKAAVKAAKEAEENRAENAAALRAEADKLKADADHWKAELREAKASAPATPKAAPATTDQPRIPEATAPQSLAAVDPEEAAKRQKRLKGLKTAYNMAHKQYKEAHAALERAERKEDVTADELNDMQRRVDKLKNKADIARDALDALVEEAKADIRAHTGKDLKTLKLEAARAESALADKAIELQRLRDSSSEESLEALNSELKALEAEAQIARKALKQAVEEQGLVE